MKSSRGVNGRNAEILCFEILGFEILGFEILGFEILGFEILRRPLRGS